LKLNQYTPQHNLMLDSKLLLELPVVTALLKAAVKVHEELQYDKIYYYDELKNMRDIGLLDDTGGALSRVLQNLYDEEERLFATSASITLLQMNAIEDLNEKARVFVTNVNTTLMAYNALYDPKFVGQLQDKEELALTQTKLTV
jgi:hypothetical protein